MGEIKAEYVNAFIMASHSLLTQMCMIPEIKVGKPTLKEAKFKDDTSVIIVGLTGDIMGHVMLVFPHEVALDIISKMTMMPMTEVDDLGISAISELGNMIMGNVATVFSSSGIGIDITPPTLSHGEVSFTSSYTKSLCVPMVFDGGGIDLFLALKQES